MRRWTSESVVSRLRQGPAGAPAAYRAIERKIVKACLLKCDANYVKAPDSAVSKAPPACWLPYRAIERKIAKSYLRNYDASHDPSAADLCPVPALMGAIGHAIVKA